jgi:hypothetical protein
VGASEGHGVPGENKNVDHLKEGIRDEAERITPQVLKGAGRE